MKELAAQEDAVLLAQDELLVTLFPDEIVDLATFVKCSTRVQAALAFSHLFASFQGGVRCPGFSGKHKSATRLVPSAV